MCDPKKRVERDDDAEEWKIDTLEEDDERSSVLASRFFNIAKHVLGYTHTEAGFRTLAQLDDEIRDWNRMKSEAEQKKGRGDLSWFMEEGED